MATAQRPWGIDDASADGGSPGSAFNAATAQRPWGTITARFRLADRTARSALQCGHGPKTVGNAGPTISPSQPCGGCFNAATAQRPWGR